MNSDYFRILTIDKENPKGTKDKCNDVARYELYYSKPRKQYYIDLSLITINNGMVSAIIMGAIKTYERVTLLHVDRRNKKQVGQCETFVKRYIDTFHDAFLAGGLAGFKTSVLDALANTDITELSVSQPLNRR